MKNIILVLLIIFITSCQREVRNNLNVGYNKTLIIPPINDLPEPNSSVVVDKVFVDSDNPIIDSILSKTDALNANANIIDQIDNESGYETDQTLFDRLFKSKNN